MKKGEPLKPMLQKIDEDSKLKKDAIVNLKSFEVSQGVNSFPDLNFGKVESGTLNDYALGQLCNKLDISSGYIRQCVPFKEVVNYNLNHWISKTKERNLMVRQSGETVRAILSDRYKRLDNDIVAHHTLNKMMDMKAEIKFAEYTGDQLNITAVTPKLKGEVKEGDEVQGGITITNCEVGTQSLLIQPFIYRLVCTNGMVAPRYLNKFYAKHVGKVLINLEEDTQAIKIIDKMQKQLELVNNPELFQENLQRLKDATEIKTTSHDIVKILKHHKVSDYEKSEIYAKLNHNISDPFFTTDKYTFANAITNIANSDDMSNERTRYLQELGGLIIFSHNPMQIRI